MLAGTPSAFLSGLESLPTAFGLACALSDSVITGFWRGSLRVLVSPGTLASHSEVADQACSHHAHAEFGSALRGGQRVWVASGGLIADRANRPRSARRRCPDHPSSRAGLPDWCQMQTGLRWWPRGRGWRRPASATGAVRTMAAVTLHTAVRPYRPSCRVAQGCQTHLFYFILPLPAASSVDPSVRWIMDPRLHGPGADRGRSGPGGPGRINPSIRSAGLLFLPGGWRYRSGVRFSSMLDVGRTNFNFVSTHLGVRSNRWQGHCIPAGLPSTSRTRNCWAP